MAAAAYAQKKARDEARRYSPHSFRATGITNFLENDGTLEAAQRIAGHADSRTTKLYDRRGQKVLLEDMERNSVLRALENCKNALACAPCLINQKEFSPSRGVAKRIPKDGPGGGKETKLML